MVQVPDSGGCAGEGPDDRHRDGRGQGDQEAAQPSCHDGHLGQDKGGRSAHW